MPRLVGPEIFVCGVWKIGQGIVLFVYFLCFFFFVLPPQILALLGPETDADREAKKAAKKGKKKGKGGGKSNKATRKDNVSEAEAAAIEAEAEALRAEWGATPKIIKYTDTPRTQVWLVGCRP